MEKGKATHTSILPWTGRIPEEFHGLYSPCGHKESDTTEQLSLSFTFLGNLDLTFNIYTIPMLKTVYKTQYLAPFKCLSVKYLISITLFSAHRLDGG